MELPMDIQRLINEYAKPLTRPDWRKGSYFNRRSYSIFHDRSYYKAYHVYTFKKLIRCLYIFKHMIGAYIIYENDNTLYYGSLLIDY